MKSIGTVILALALIAITTISLFLITKQLGTDQRESEQTRRLEAVSQSFERISSGLIGLLDKQADRSFLQIMVFLSFIFGIAMLGLIAWSIVRNQTSQNTGIHTIVHYHVAGMINQPDFKIRVPHQKIEERRA